MSIREFLKGSSRIVYDGKKIHLRVVKEALKKNFRLVVLEESPQHCKCEIVRFPRFYRTPGFLFNPTMNLYIEKENMNTTIKYHFSCPEFRWVIVSSALFGLLATLFDSKMSILERTLVGFSSFIFGFCIFGLVVFLDTKLISGRIRKVLIKL
jgi:hypothetical protein